MLTVEQQIERIADAAVARSTESVEPSRGSAERQTRWVGTRRLVGFAAALMLVALLGALVTGLDRRDSTSDLDQTPQPTQRFLREETEIGPSDWMVATTELEGTEFLFALAPTFGETARTAWYGTRSFDGSGELVRLTLGGDGEVYQGATEEIADATWTVSQVGTFWKARRFVDSTDVSVTGPGMFDDGARELIDGLALVPESMLPATPLGIEQVQDVAQFVLDGRVISLAVQESNGYWCFWERSEEGSSGGCGAALDPSADITFDAGSTTTEAGSEVAEVVRGGTVTARASRVDVEFADATVVSVVPVDLTGQFDRKFWLAAANIDGPARSVSVVRAYDADGQLIAVQSPS